MDRLLIIEDDNALAGGLCRALSSSETIAESCGSLKDARQKIDENNYNLILLDVNLPDGNGFDFLQEMRHHNRIPIIMLTANDMETDIVAGLELGADDYITKPFSLAVLRARVKACMRKNSVHDISEGCTEIDDYIFDFERMEFSKAGNRIELSKTEQKLLKVFINNIGITLSRSVLVDRIWADGAVYVDENALSVTVKRLRDKLSAQEYIKTVYGTGYMWVKK